MAKRGRDIYVGDRYALCTFPISNGGKASSWYSADDLGELCAQIPEYAGMENKISVCEVKDGKWVRSATDPSDSEPLEVDVLYEVVHYKDPED